MIVTGFFFLFQCKKRIMCFKKNDHSIVTIDFLDRIMQLLIKHDAL